VSVGLLVIEISRSHWHTPHSVGQLWLNDQPDAETTDYKRHKYVMRQTSISPAAFEPAIRASEQMQTHALDHGATGTGSHFTQAGWKRVTCQTYEKSRRDGMCAEPIVEYDRWCSCLWYTFCIVHHIFVWRSVLDKNVLSSSFGWIRGEITGRPIRMEAN